MLDSSYLQASAAAALTWEVPALALGVSVGAEVETAAIGCDPGTLFRVASITKPFTALLAVGLLDLEESSGIWPPDVRVRHLLSQRINELTEHLRTHKHDHYSRRGLLKLVGRRRRFLNYLQRKDLEGYRALIKELGLRR